MYDMFNLYSLYRELKDYLEEKFLGYKNSFDYYEEKIKKIPSDSLEYEEAIVNLLEIKGIYKELKDILYFLENLEKEYLEN